MVLSKTMLLKLKKYKLKIDKFIFLFAILILLQFLVISLFQSKLSYRNYDLNGPLNLIKSRCKNNKFALNYNYMNYFSFENYLFIAYQLLLAYLGLDALFKEYVMQIFVYFLMNIGGYVYLIIQMVEIVISIKYLRDECLTSALTHENDLLEKFRLNGIIQWIDEESNRGMTHSSYLWISLYLIILYYVLLELYSYLKDDLIYFGVSLTSYIYVLKVKEDFGKGLKEAKQSALNALNDNDENIIIVTLNEKQ
ncbi:unnamed protein product [Rhizophagus irregularis]|nr:unnamed protein product [Rhizophagus irregularis]